MSGNEVTKQQLKALRQAGHDEAANLLVRLESEREREEVARRGPGEARPSGLRLPALSDSAVSQAEAQAANAMLEAVNALPSRNPTRVPALGGNR